MKRYVAAWVLYLIWVLGWRRLLWVRPWAETKVDFTSLGMWGEARVRCTPWFPSEGERVAVTSGQHSRGYHCFTGTVVERSTQHGGVLVLSDVGETHGWMGYELARLPWSRDPKASATNRRLWMAMARMQQHLAEEEDLHGRRGA